MVRRMGGGGLGSEILRRRLESCKNKYSSVDEIVDYLRSNYPDYRRLKQQPFTKQVQHALDSSSRRRKNPRKAHDIEERLLRLENNHLKRRRQNDSFSSSSSWEEEEGDGALSTSDETIFGEKVEPEFDLVKSMLRATYTEAKSANGKAKSKKAEEKNIEFEVSAPRKLDTVDGIHGEFGMKKELTKDSVSDNVDVKKNEGPKFRDLGGMGSVLEELKMEVIVPLYHPQLPRWLGVRPMAGILLHGPPGCGKTRLAHAIANETGVPFYKISATELVSGVSGASEENIRELFAKAYRTAPSIVFIDEIDAIASKRENLQRLLHN